MIVMDSSSQLTVDVISKVAQSKMSVSDAAKILQKSHRTIERYLKRFLEEGIQFVVHRNTGKQPSNKIPDALKKQVQTLIRDKYYDTNLQHLTELLERNEGISVKRETLRNWAHDIHHVKRAKRRRSSVRKRRERMASPGLLLQMDGSPHRWFGNKKSCLVAIIDDATSEIHAEFFESETTQACMKVMQGLILQKGLFRALYVDRAGIFGGPKRCNFSQMQRACEELGIEIIFANSPQGKGRIERAFDTLQDRLVPELRLQNIQDMDRANDYLKNVFLPEFWNARLVVQPETTSSEYRPVPESVDLAGICSQKEHRKIRNDHTFSYGNRMYLIESDLKHSIAKQEIEIRKQHDGHFTAYFAGRALDISEVVEPSRASVYDLEIQKKIDAIELAEKLGNVSEAARISGCSRETIYTNRRLLRERGPQALKRQFCPDLHHKNRAPESTELLVLSFSLDNPHLGQAQVSAQIRELHGLEISPSGVRNIWVREKMNTAAQRLERSRATVAA
jgi:transposase